MERDELLDALLGMPTLMGAEASPDGTWVAWNWMGIGDSIDVYAAPTDGSSEPVRLTSGDDDVVLVSWTPDSRSVIVRQDHGGDERFQLCLVRLERPGEMEPLTEPEPPYFLRGGRLHPNGRLLFYGMNYDVETGQEIEATWLYRHDLETGERTAITRPEKAAFFDPAPNEQGDLILYDRQDLDPSGSQVWLVDIDGRNDRELLNAGPTRKVEAGWFPDGRHVLFLAETDTYRRLGIIDVKTGNERTLIDDPTRNIEGACAPRGSNKPVVVVLEVDQARVKASLLDPETGDETVIPSSAGALIPLRQVGDRWVAQQYSSTVPGDLVLIDPLNPDVRTAPSLTRLWECTDLSPDDLVPAEDFRWHADDGLEIQGWLYRSRGSARGTVVKVHGGPTAHSEDAYDAQVQFLALRGFNVLLPNYRGSTGFGLPFQEAIKQDGWGGREQDDIRAGIEALLSAGIARPGTVGITGNSYGGYSSWCGITRWPRDILAAAAPSCGMTDLVVDYETTRPDLRPYSEEMMGGAPAEVPERYHERSPIHFVENIRGNLLIIQGLRDPNVTPENVQVVRRALEQHGIPYDVLTFEDEGHGVYLRPNRVVMNRRLEEFFSGAFE